MPLAYEYSKHTYIHDPFRNLPLLEMAPPYVTSSFREHAKWLGFFSECPILWDPEREFLRYRPTAGNRWVKMWHVDLFISVDTVIGAAFVYIAFQILRYGSEKPYMPLELELILALLGFITYVIVNHVMVALYGKDAVNGFNEIMKIEGNLVGRTHIGKL